jgi:hypothetical protein
MTINNNNIFGAFTLNEARGSRLTGDWLNTDTIANYGWFGGGTTPTATLSSVDRIDFSNDTATANIRGSLTSARQRLASAENSNYSWFGGGSNPGGGSPQSSTVQRIDFSNDSPTTSPRGPLSIARNDLAAAGNSNYGWFGGGYFTSPATIVTAVDRIDFSNDASTASPRGPLTLARGLLAATGNSNYGWFAGGTLGGTSIVDRIDFSNDASTASPRGSLSIARWRLSATGNSNYGWFGATGAAGTTNMDRIDFSNDSSTASSRGPLSSIRYATAATGNSNYGWWGGGLFPIPTGGPAVDRIDFSNDTGIASPRGPLNSARESPVATSGVLNIRRQKAGNYGWFGGGSSPARVSRVDRIDFSNDTGIALQRGSITPATGRSSLASTGNSNYGWFGGGAIPAATAVVDRIDFSNDSSTTLVRGSLSAERYGLYATGNSNYGWFGGGSTPPAPGTHLSTVDRIDFSNDSSTASVRGPLTNPARGSLAATGNSNYGWWVGGVGPFPSSALQRVDRIDFSNDSATALPRGLLSIARQDLEATGNSNYGWFGGGGDPTPQSRVDRIDFSNDSATSSPRGPLSAGRTDLAATGNSNYGWFGGGNTGLLVATVDRINFANDSATASPRGPLTLARFSFSATSNTSR